VAEERYKERFLELLEQDRKIYERLNRNLGVVPEIGRQLGRGAMLDVSQAVEIANESNNGILESSVFSEDFMKFLLDFYDDLGIISSEEKINVYGDAETRLKYRFPNYHGKGYSSSWTEIEEELEEAAREAEEIFCWDQRKVSDRPFDLEYE
jgi:hypothetical protein